MKKKQSPSMNILESSHILEKKEQKIEFQSDLLGWYDQHKRTLPWRTSPNLYKTVVSEFMLQQTRVSTVLPYFKKWIDNFPDFESLAKAKEETVLKYWEGLGYYSRARNLHKLSKVVSNWDNLETDGKAWLTLPGVGPYISAAIVSISFGKAEAVCDGNVVRVLSRIFGIDEMFKDGATAQKKIRPLAQKLITEKRPGDYNQAIMELGATICHRQNPLCTICPVLSFCSACKQGNPEKFPKIRQKKKSKKKVTRFWIVSSSGILLQKSEKKSKRLAGIYELPGEQENFSFLKEVLITQKKRTIGNTEYDESIFQAKIEKDIVKKGNSLQWVKWKDLDNITLSGPHRKWIEEIRTISK